MNARNKEAQWMRMQSLVDGVPRLGPQTVHIDVTNACNTDCVTCWDHSPHLQSPKPAAWKRQRADPDFIKNLLDDMQSLGGLESVIISGMGEPFTHPAIYSILQDIKARGLHLTVITNLMAADAEKILDVDVDELLIGIHGASEAAYLAFHPSFTSKHWQRLHEDLEKFRRAGKRYKHVHVICQTNAHELPQMVELAAHAQAGRVNFKFASLKNGTQAVRVSDEQRRALVDTWIPQAEELARVHDVTTNLRVFQDQVQTGGAATAPIEDVGCFLGFHYSRITVEKEVLYCCNTEVFVGTIDEGKSFSRLWQSDDWAALRGHLKNGHFFVGCEQCGKFNQNVKLSDRFRRQYGDALWREVSGIAARESGRRRPLVVRGALQVLP